MAAHKLTLQQRASIKELAARMSDQDGATAREIAEEWNSTHPEKHHLTPRAVLYYLLKMRQEKLSKAEDHVAAMTDRTTARLAAIALGDSRSVVTWEGDDVVVVDSSKLTEAEAAQLSIKVTKRNGAEKVVEISVDPNVKVRAARDLLVFLHGSRVSVTESGAIISRLTESGDREGLERIASGEDPVRVLIDRAPFLTMPDESADE